MEVQKHKVLSELTEEERHQALERYNTFIPLLLDSVPLAEISRLSNIPYSTLLKWSKRYKLYGLAGLANKERSDKGNHRKIN